MLLGCTGGGGGGGVEGCAWMVTAVQRPPSLGFRLSQGRMPQPHPCGTQGLSPRISPDHRVGRTLENMSARGPDSPGMKKGHPQTSN